MKKITGWLIIVLCSVFLLIFGSVLVITIIGLSKDSTNVQSSASAMISSLFAFGFMILLLVYGLSYGIKRVKKDKAITIVEYPGNLNINLAGQIAYKDYRNLMLGMSYKKPTYLLLIVILLINIVTFFTIPKEVQNHLDANYFTFIIVGVLAFSPLLTLYQINKIYRNTKIFHEHINYLLTNETIQITGDTVNSVQKWTHFFKIKETDTFFMLYPGERVVILLDKKMFNGSDMEEFRKFTQSLNVVRK